MKKHSDWRLRRDRAGFTRFERLTDAQRGFLCPSGHADLLLRLRLVVAANVSMMN